MYKLPHPISYPISDKLTPYVFDSAATQPSDTPTSSFHPLGLPQPSPLPTCRLLETPNSRNGRLSPTSIMNSLPSANARPHYYVPSQGSVNHSLPSLTGHSMRSNTPWLPPHHTHYHPQNTSRFVSSTETNLNGVSMAHTMPRRALHPLAPALPPSHQGPTAHYAQTMQSFDITCSSIPSYLQFSSLPLRQMTPPAYPGC
jgi:hypothetical protein